MTFALGTVIHATLRPEDLIPAFADKLESLLPLDDTSKAYFQLVKDAHEIDFNKEYDGEIIGELIEELMDALCDMAPPYVYFGNTEGDGSDFGFWPDIETLKDDIRYDNVGEELEIDISDHGNVTVYKVEYVKKRVELWSCV